MHEVQQANPLFEVRGMLRLPEETVSKMWRNVCGGQELLLPDVHEKSEASIG